MTSAPRARFARQARRTWGLCLPPACRSGSGAAQDGGATVTVKLSPARAAARRPQFCRAGWLAVAGLLAASIAALTQTASGQVATPDRRISDSQPLYSQGIPSLSASGQQIVAVWLGQGYTGEVVTAGIGYGYS